MQSSDHYSIWIEPDGEVFEIFQQWIRSLAERYHDPVFEPHVTLLNRIRMPEQYAESTCRALAEQLGPFEIQLKGFGSTNEFYRRFFLKADAGPELLDANSKAQMLFHLDYQPDYQPHLSLLYGPASESFQDNFENEIFVQKNARTTFRFVADSLDLIRTEGKPEQWTRLGRYPLKASP